MESNVRHVTTQTVDIVMTTRLSVQNAKKDSTLEMPTNVHNVMVRMLEHVTQQTSSHVKKDITSQRKENVRNVLISADGAQRRLISAHCAQTQKKQPLVEFVKNQIPSAISMTRKETVWDVTMDISSTVEESVHWNHASCSLMWKCRIVQSVTPDIT